MGQYFIIDDCKFYHFFNNYGNNVDAFVVMSEHQKNYLHDKWGINEDLIYVIPISHGKRNTHSARSVSNERINVISAFRMCWEKNISCGGNLLRESP